MRQPLIPATVSPLTCFFTRISTPPGLSTRFRDTPAKVDRSPHKGSQDTVGGFSNRASELASRTRTIRPTMKPLNGPPNVPAEEATNRH